MNIMGLGKMVICKELVDQLTSMMQVKKKTSMLVNSKMELNTDTVNTDGRMAQFIKANGIRVQF